MPRVRSHNQLNSSGAVDDELDEEFSPLMDRSHSVSVNSTHSSPAFRQIRLQNGRLRSLSANAKTKLQQIQSYLSDPNNRIPVIVLLVGGITACIVLSWLFSSSKVSNEVCTSPECVVAAALILKSIDNSVDPCEDFFEFSCGNWIKANPLPDDKSTVGAFNTLSDHNELVLKRIIEEPYKPDLSLSEKEATFDRETLSKMQRYYRSCINETALNVAGATPMVDFLSAIYKDMRSSELNPKWLSTFVSRLQLISFAPLFSIYVQADIKNLGFHIISLAQDGLNLPSKEYYNDTAVMAVYNTTLFSVFSKWLPGVTGVAQSDIQSAVDRVLKFESKMASVSKPSSELSDPAETYNKHSIKTLRDLAPAFDWKLYFDLMFPSADFKLRVSDDTEVVIDNPAFFKSLSLIVNESNKEDLTFYLLWTAMHSLIYRLDLENRQLLNALAEKTGSRPKSDPPRWKTCLGQVDLVMGDVLAKWYVQQEFTGNSKSDAEKTIEGIRRAFVDKLPQINWIDGQTSALAIKKANLLHTKIGYPDFIFSPSKSFDKYARLNFSSNDYFANHLAKNAFNSWFDRRNIDIEVDRSVWAMPAFAVNAYYSPALNEIVFPAGILQPPFYNAMNPKYLNFGAIGVVVGHELTHAFDNNGRKFNDQGQLADWWTNATAVRFEEKSKCFEYQFSNYTVDIPDQGPQHVDGKLTMGENLADAGGLSRAFEAWQTEKYMHPQQDWKMPGLANYSYEQLFFISFAQVWCGATRPAALLKRLRTDPHSPAQFRVNGAAQNSLEFAKAFQCKSQAKMNPKDKCIVW